MRREELYLKDILEAITAIEKFLHGISKKTFISDDLIRSAVLQKLTIVGEAASRLPQAFRSKHPEIEWPDIIAFRNLAVHAYFALDWNIVWITATKDVSALKTKLLSILSK